MRMYQRMYEKTGEMVNGSIGVKTRERREGGGGTLVRNR